MDTEVQEFYTIEQIAKKLNVGHLAIRKEIKAGKLKACKIGKQYRISIKQLNEYLYPSE